MELVGRRYDTGEIVGVDIVGDRVQSLRPESSAANESVPWLAPGFVDLQANGYRGQEFNDPALTVDKVRQVALAMDADGVTSFCATLTTHGYVLLHHSLTVLAEALERDPDVRARIPGIHLEGPYISPDDGPRGAHPRVHVRPPDWDEFCRLQAAARGGIRIVTLSPEYDGAAEFVRRAAASDVVVAIGHTQASSDQIRAAVDAGARMSTHLGNGAHGQIRRHPNYIWDQLAEDRLTASLIVDGHHLPPSVVKSFVRGKTPERTVLVSDITGMGGMPPGRYDSPLGSVEVLDDGRLVIAGQRQLLAGAALPITYGIANVMRFAGVDLKTAVEMASTRPASLIGSEPGRLAPGGLASFVLFDLANDGPVQIRGTVQRGRKVA